MAKVNTGRGRVRLLLVFLSALTVLFAACQPNSTGKTPPKAIRGVLDLTDWDFAQDGPVDLSGEWEFYWHQHLYAQQFALPIQPDISAYVNVPRCWNAYSVDGEALPGQGFATFRLTVRMHRPAGSLALEKLDLSSAYRLYVNGEKVDSAGVAGKSFETTNPGFHHGIARFSAGTDSLELISRVNHGLWP